MLPEDRLKKLRPILSPIVKGKLKKTSKLKKMCQMNPQSDADVIHVGVIGYPIAHSRSPFIHNAWHEIYQLKATYTAIPVLPEHLEQALIKAKAKKFRGLNVTVPHKESVLQYIHEIDAVARRIGAANTLRFTENKVQATNTDAYGFIENLKHNNRDITPYLQHVILLGAGGAARAIIVGLQDAGAKKITIINRSAAKAQSLCAEFSSDICEMLTASWEVKNEALKTASLLINATSLGMQHMDSLDINLQHLPKTALVNDIVYSPLHTNLLKRARANGNEIVTGIGMLVYQAQRAFEYWHGVLPKMDDAFIARIASEMAQAEPPK
jgi:shikimate dehydrogenase